MYIVLVDVCADVQESQKGAIQGGGHSCEPPYMDAENQILWNSSRYSKPWAILFKNITQRNYFEEEGTGETRFLCAAALAVLEPTEIRLFLTPEYWD